MKKEHEQVKINKYARKDGRFLSHAHYRDPYFDFIYLLTNFYFKDAFKLDYYYKVAESYQHTNKYYLKVPIYNMIIIIR